MRRSWTVVLVALIAALPAGQATAAGVTVTITARQMTTDAGGRVVATGGVRISDGTTVAVGERVVLDPRRRTAVFTPGVVRGPQGLLRGRRLTVRYRATRLTEVSAAGDAGLDVQQARITADEITLRLADESVLAAGRVRVRARPDLQAEGTRLLFRRRTDVLAMAGPVRMQTAQGRGTAGRLEARHGGDDVRLWRDVRLHFGDIAARADAATLLVPAKRAMLAGAVRVEQRGRVLWAERVTVDYGTGRVVAAGPLRIRIPDTGAP